MSLIPYAARGVYTGSRALVPYVGRVSGRGRFGSLARGAGRWLSRAPTSDAGWFLSGAATTGAAMMIEDEPSSFKRPRNETSTPPPRAVRPPNPFATPPRQPSAAQPTPPRITWPERFHRMQDAIRDGGVSFAGDNYTSRMIRDPTIIRRRRLLRMSRGKKNLRRTRPVRRRRFVRSRRVRRRRSKYIY